MHISKLEKSINKVTQKNVKAGGDVIAGDKIIIESPKSALRRLSDELQDLLAADGAFNGIIDRLQKFLSLVEDAEPGRNLETKLMSANRGHELKRAKRLKESFSKRITRHQFSDQAQEFFAQVLAHIITVFMKKVRPKILGGASQDQIDSVLFDDLISPIYNEIGDCSLGISTEDIEGMIYYLTGNCHLEWE